MLLNKKRAESFLENYKLDALVASSRENTTYLTDFLAVEHIFSRMYNGLPGSGEKFIQVYGVYSRNGNRVLILPSSLFMIMKADQHVTEDVLTYGKGISTTNDKVKLDTFAEREFHSHARSADRNFETAADALIFALKEFSPGHTIGADLTEMDLTSVARMNTSSFHIKRANELFRFLRMVKSSEEVARLSIAAEINEVGVEYMFKLAKHRKRRTLTEIDLEREYMIRIAELGGSKSGGKVMCPVGSRGGSMSSPTTTKLRDKKMIWFDTSCSYKGYQADTGESGTLGKPSEKQRKYYEAVLDAVETSERILAPGMKPSQLNTSITQVFEKRGIPRPPTGMGHGIGLEIYDYPRISAVKGNVSKNDSVIKDDIIESSIDIPFEEGMTLALEAPYLVWGWGGVHAEVTVLLEKSKTRRLVKGQKRYLREL